MTLLEEFYASFIAQRLTLKVINMDTLYLVFKDRFLGFKQTRLSCSPDSLRCQLPPKFLLKSFWLLPHRRQFRVPSKKAYYRNGLRLSSTFSPPLKAIFRDETAALPTKFSAERSGPRKLSVACDCQPPCFRQRGIIGMARFLSSAT